MDQFQSKSCEERRQQILSARAKGSVTADMKSGLDQAKDKNKLVYINDDITDAKYSTGTTTLIGQAGQYECDQVILATGFQEIAS